MVGAAKSRPFFRLFECPDVGYCRVGVRWHPSRTGKGGDTALVCVCSSWLVHGVLYIIKLEAVARSRPSSRTTAASSAAGPLGASPPAAAAAAADSASTSISATASRARRDGVFPLPGCLSSTSSPPRSAMPRHSSQSSRERCAPGAAGKVEERSDPSYARARPACACGTGCAR